MIYICAAIVGDPQNATAVKQTSTNVTVLCDSGCGDYRPERETHFVLINGTTPINTSLPVTCVEGLNFTNESTTKVVCGVDGKWLGEPDCQIPGDVLFTKDSYSFKIEEIGTFVCEVTDYHNWQTVMIDKRDSKDNGSVSPVFSIFHENETIRNKTLDDTYNISTILREDGVSISLSLNPDQCGDEMIYTCAAIVGDPQNATAVKQTSTSVTVLCDSGCGDYRPERETHFVLINGTTLINTSLSVTCVDGLDFTNESTTEVVCGVDGKWLGQPDCRIPGHVLFTKDSYSFKNGEIGTFVCEVTDYHNWQTVMIGKRDSKDNGSFTPVLSIFHENETIKNKTLDDTYNISTILREDGVSISLSFSPDQCSDEMIYTCAAIVGDPQNATAVKQTSTNVTVLCDSGCGDYIPERETHFVLMNGTTPINTSLSVTCVDGLDFTNESTTEVVCGVDGKWLGQPDCRITGHVSFTEENYVFSEGTNATVICAVTKNQDWQTVVVLKRDTMDTISISRVFQLFHENETIQHEALNDNYRISHTINTDGVSISLNFNPVTCDDRGIYSCAAVVGDIENATAIKQSDTNVNISCLVRCEETVFGTDKYYVQTNGTEIVNTTLPVTCIDGLELTNESDKEVICGANGQWQGEPDCRIPGNVSFSQSEYIFRIGENSSAICQVTNYPTWQTVLVGKRMNLDDHPLDPIVHISKDNASDPVQRITLNKNYTVDYTVDAGGISVAVKLIPAICNNEGEYTCAAIVGDPENPIDIRVASTTVTITSESLKPKIVVPERVYLGREAKVYCTGHIGKEPSGETLGKLSMVTNFGVNGSVTVYNGSNTPIEKGCYFEDTISVTIPTDSVSSGLWAKCVTQDRNGTILESEQKNISIQTAFIAFENSSYLFNIGQNATFVCEFENIQEWRTLDISNDGRRVVEINATEVPTFSRTNLVQKDSFLTNSSGRLVVAFDPVQCSDTPESSVGDVEYLCTVMTANNTFEAKTVVTFQSPPSRPELTLSYEIIEGKGTWRDRPFTCKGEIGDPPGHIEVESNFDGEFSAFLAPFIGANKTSFGWIFNNTIEETNCSNYQTIGFALENITTEYMHLKSLRCVTKPSADIEQGTEMYSEQKVIKVVPENYCEDATTYTSHPYYCNMAIICNDDGSVYAVPEPCETDECADTANGETQQCTSCGMFASECKSRSVQCDRSTKAAYNGNTVSFLCNTQDYGEVTHISVNNLVNVDIDGEASVEIKEFINVAVSQYYVLLSFTNISCEQEEDYIIRLNNETDISLKLRVLSNAGEPMVYLPEIMNANQETKLNCSGYVGRDEEGENKTAIYLEVMSKATSEFEKYNSEEIRQPVVEECEIRETVTFSILPDLSWNNTLVRCVSRNKTDIVAVSQPELVIIEVPELFCQPLIQTSRVGGSVSFSCLLKDIPAISSVVVSKNGSEVINKENTTFPFEEENNGISLMATSEEIRLTFSNTSCEQEGNYDISINDDLSADVSLRIVSPVGQIYLNLSTDGRINEEFEIVCSGEIGRDEEGNALSKVYLEIKFATETQFTTYDNDAVTRQTDWENCKKTETVRLTFFPDTSWNNSEVRCVARNETHTITSSDEQDIHINRPDAFFENTDLIGVVGESLILTCVVANMKNLSDIIISKGENKTVIVSYSSDSMIEGVTVISDESSINGTSGVLKINVSLQCGDDGMYYCTPEGSGPDTEATAYVELQRKPGTPVMTLSREIIENKFTLADRPFICEGDLGNPAGTIEIQSDLNGTFETFLSPSANLKNNSLAWIFNDIANSSSCRNYRTIQFAFHNITMDIQLLRLRCVIHPASDLSVSLEDLYDEKAIYVIPAYYCVGKSGHAPHPYFCHLRVQCNVSNGIIEGVPSGCDEDLCYNDAWNCVSCSTVGGCNITGPTTTTTTTSTTRSPESIYMISEDLTGTNGQNAEVTCTLNNIDIDFINLTLSPVIVLLDDYSSPIFNSSRDRLNESYSFVTTNDVEITLKTATITLKFKPLRCQHVGGYTFRYESLETTSRVDIAANISTPTLSKEPDMFYRNQKAVLTCTGDVGRPKGDLVLEENTGEYTWQEVSEVTRTEIETENCTTLATLTHEFYVHEGLNGHQYRCQSSGYNGEVLITGIEVTVSDAVLYFTETTVNAEIGSTVELTCVLEGTLSSSSGIIISRNVGEETVCNVSHAGIVCSSTRFTGNVSTSENNTTIQVTIEPVNCEDEGIYFCVAVSDESLQALTTLSVSKTPEGKPLLSIPSRMVVDLEESLNNITCSANVGYPAGDLQIQFSNDNFVTYQNWSIGVAEAPPEENEGCSINKSISYKEYTYTQSLNNTEIRCVVYYPSDDTTPSIISDIQTITLMKNDCPPEGVWYQNYPFNCHYYISCNGGFPTVVEHCMPNCPNIIENKTAPHCTADCSHLVC